MPERHDPEVLSIPFPERTDNTIGLMVSLFLILVTFFIVLGSISGTSLGRATPVVESVNAAFKGGNQSYRPGVDGVDILARDRIAPHRELFYRAGEETLQALMDFNGAYAADGGDVMQAELRTSVLFLGDDVSVRIDQTKFLNSLADMLKNENLGEERAVEIMFATPPQAFGKKPELAQLNMQRASALARELEARGVPGRSITAGFAPNKRDVLWLTFTSRSAQLMQRDRGDIGGDIE